LFTKCPQRKRIAHNQMNYYPFDSHPPKRISFVLVTKNRAPYLAHALERMRKLVTKEDEFILIDGGSTDGTRDTISRYQDIIDVVVSEPDTDATNAVNKGILLARGKYIKHLSDDDTFYPEAIEQSVRIMEEHPEIDLLLCGGTKERNGKVWDYSVPPGVNYGKSVEDVFRYKGASGVGQFIQRSSLARLGVLIPTGVNTDTEFVAELIVRGAVVRFCRINSYHHIIYDHSLTVRDKRGHGEDTKRLVKKYCSQWFYFKYRLRNLDREVPIIAGLWLLLKKGRYTSGGMAKSHLRDVEWDGEFS